MNGAVVVGTDGTETATVAVREAIEIAKCFGQTLHIVCAYQADLLVAEGAGGEFKTRMSRLEMVNASLDDVATIARAGGVTVETHAVRDDPADAILDLATKLGAGLIVVGNKGIGQMRRVVLGNVPSKVVHNAPCSTYVVHTT